MPQLYLRYGATIALAILAYVFWKERGEDFGYTQHGHFHEDRVASEAVQHDPPSLAQGSRISFTRSYASEKRIT